MIATAQLQGAAPAFHSTAAGGPGIDSLAHLARSRHLECGDTLFEEGEPARELFELVEGLVKLYKLLPDGRCQIVGFLYPEQLVGLAVGGVYAYSAETVRKSEVRVYDKKRFEAAVDGDPNLMRRLTASVSGELGAAQEHLMVLGRRTATERVAWFLLALAEREGRTDSLEIPMTREDIGSYLGLTTETVSRCFSLMKDSGMLTLDGARRVSMPRLDDLRMAAEGEIDIGSPTRNSGRLQRAVWPA